MGRVRYTLDFVYLRKHLPETLIGGGIIDKLELNCFKSMECYDKLIDSSRVCLLL